MKEAASLLATGYIQEYYDKVYAQSDNTFKTTYSNIGAYAKYKFPNATEGGFTYAVADSQLTVTDTKGNSVTGTILDDGTIDWSNITTGGGTGNEEGGPTIVGDVKPQRWDSVNYNPGTLSTASLDLPEGAEIEKTKLASLDLPAGATLSSDVTANQATDWKILDYDEETGDVLIIPTDGTFAELTLIGMNGYNNAIEALDKVASIYKNPTYAKRARSITVDDVNHVEGYDPAISASASVTATSTGNSELSYSWNNRYGMDVDLNIIDYGEGNEAERTYFANSNTKSYSYTTEYFAELPNEWFWLASRCVGLSSEGCTFRVRGLNGDGPTVWLGNGLVYLWETRVFGRWGTGQLIKCCL